MHAIRQSRFFFLLVGDADASSTAGGIYVPAATYADPVNGSMIVTDNAFADMDADAEYDATAW